IKYDPYNYIYGRWVPIAFNFKEQETYLYGGCGSIIHYEYCPDSTVINDQLCYKEVSKFWIKDSLLYEASPDTVVYRIVQLDKMNIGFITPRKDRFGLKKNYYQVIDECEEFFKTNEDSIWKSYGINEK